MNFRIITKNHETDLKIGSPQKIDFRTDETQESHPATLELKYLRTKFKFHLFFCQFHRDFTEIMVQPQAPVQKNILKMICSWKANFDSKIWRYFRKDHSFIYLYPGNSKFLIVCIAYHTFWKVAAIFTVISPPNSLISVGSKLFIPKLSHVFKTFFRCKLSLRGFSVNWFEKKFRNSPC